ncbi:MAG: GTPase [Acidobacteria bacterium RIFCSPLOWO2_12_FULL_67_14]|nr:MAG: GTPase [Acidobacteria bacterium RIFCSPLOWO2_02_FULL_67_21]OFW35816.1 MAG: GTPase [Acidobacteria bacterium RIFCSPLOWO2_12_FULL_67_14]
MTSDPICEGVLVGDARAVARAISLVEDGREAGVDLVRRVFNRTGRAYLVGITGPPGAGKSTLVDHLTIEARREDRHVGVIAVDPTSPFTGGAVLGDRVRMGRHASDQEVFIRSMATRGHLGGVARATADAAVILDASGKDLIFIETVGVGQDEVEIARTADVTVVVLVPGTGDEVQALKAGIMEIADIFVVNKADRDGAERLVQSISANLSLQAFGPEGWRPPIVKTVATTGEGLPELWAAIGDFRSRAATGETRRRTRHEHHLRELLGQELLRRLEGMLAPGAFDRTVERVARHEVDPYSAASQLIDEYVGRVPRRDTEPSSRGPAGRP